MNIFAVDHCPKAAARALCDQHVVKMALESAQMLSCINGGPYKPTHPHHPCTVWAGSSAENYLWLVEHGIELCREYTRRWGRYHQCQRVLEQLRPVPGFIMNDFHTPFVQAMPEGLRSHDHVASYRAYYLTKTFARWRHSLPPDWWLQSIAKTC